MGLTYDPELMAAMQPLMAARASMPVLALHDVEGRRAGVTAMFGGIIAALPDAPDVKWTRHTIKSYDGADVPLIQFTPKGTLEAEKPGAALLMVHGGGMIIGELDVFAKAIALLASGTGMQVFAPDYRVAPEHPHPALVEDTYASLTWLHDHAKEFNIDPTRIGIQGESAGGGIAAGVALMARDRHVSPPLAKMILIYPMLDDRNLTPDEAIEPLAIWRNEDNITGWSALLGKGKPGGPDTDPYAAPARAKSLKGLPSTYIDVGELDLFRDESIDFAARLVKENSSVELHVYPLVPHVFEALGPMTGVAQRALANRKAAALSF